MLRSSLAALLNHQPRSLVGFLGEVLPKHLLAIGTMPDALRAGLEGHGCLVGMVPHVGGAVLALRDRAFDGVLLRPEGDHAVAFAAALKQGARFAGLGEPFLDPIRHRVSHVPFWFAPQDGDDEYAVVLTASFLAFRRERETPMAELICRLKRLEPSVASC